MQMLDKQKGKRMFYNQWKQMAVLYVSINMTVTRSNSADVLIILQLPKSKLLGDHSHKAILVMYSIYFCFIILHCGREAWYYTSIVITTSIFNTENIWITNLRFGSVYEHIFGIMNMIWFQAGHILQRAISI